MRWESARQSSNIEDRRGLSGGAMVGGGGVGMIILVLLFSFISGRSPLELLSEVEQSAPPEQSSAPTGNAAADDPQARFVGAVLGDTEDTWSQIFAASNRRYEEPVLVLFDGSVQSACGSASAAVGPFYCPGDHKVYLDLSFFRELDQRFGAPGDFAQAYVVAHEVGHHVQTLLGITDGGSRASRLDANARSVLMELQADCFAGVWGHHAARKQLLDPDDVDEGLRAAAAIGDDRLQRQAQGYVVPESFTHGSSAQRARWLKRGLETGDVNACDTSSTDRP